MGTRFDPNGLVLGMAVLAAAAVGGVWAHASGDGVSVEPSRTGVSELYFGARPSVSDDGRWVVFEGRPPTEDGRSSTVWLVDRAAPPDTDPVELTAADERLRPGDSVRPALSGDGCVVAVLTQYGLDLFRDDDRGERWDVYRQVLPHCGGDSEWELVSSTTAVGTSAMASDDAMPGETPALSWTGATVAFTRRVTIAGASFGQVSLVDLTVPIGDADRVTDVPGLPDAPPETGAIFRGQSHPDISADGQVVVFAADAIPADGASVWVDSATVGTAATSHVLRWERDMTDPAQALQLLSAIDGRPASQGASAPAISADGRYIVTESASPDLVASSLEVPCGDVCPTQIVRFDSEAGDPLVVGASAPAGPAGDLSGPLIGLGGGAWSPSISADGRLVAFTTRDRDVFPVRSEVGPDPFDGDVVVADLLRGELTRVSVQTDGATPASATNAHPAITASGHLVVFDTLAGEQLGRDRVISGDPSAGGRHVGLADLRPRLVPASLDVGTVTVGVPGPEWYVSIRNEGPSTFLPSTVVSSDPRFAVTGGTCGLGVAVGAGESCTVYVTLTPDAAGPLAASITVSDSLFEANSTVVSASGAGGEPVLDPTPAGADFPPTAVGAVARSVAFDIANIGFLPDGVVAIDLRGPNPADFAVVSTSCSGVLLYPTTSCSVEVQFRPTDTGYRSAVLTLTSATGASTSVVLSGTASRIVTLDVVDRRVRPGQDVEVIGTGFPGGGSVAVAWADGRGEAVVVKAAPDGSIAARLPTRVNERPGDRTIVAVGSDSTAMASVEILRRRTSTPFGT